MTAAPAPPGDAGARSRRAPAAYAALAERLRRQLHAGEFAGGRPLPTEAELAAAHGVSRHTVRRAFQDLVAEGAVYRVPGRGTFAAADSGKYLRSSGTIEELLALELDTELELLAPPTARVDVAAAGRLRLASDVVVTVRFRRLHRGRPYCVTEAHVPEEIGRVLAELPELAEVGRPRRMTVLAAVQRAAGRRLAGADQSITAVAAPAAVARWLDVAPGDPVLRIDRVYFDDDRHLVELAINHFDPDRYSYRFEMRARAG